MPMLGVTVPVERMVRAAAIRWYGHVLRRDEGDILKEALNFEVIGKRKRGRPMATWKSRLKIESKN